MVYVLATEAVGSSLAKRSLVAAPPTLSFDFPKGAVNFGSDLQLLDMIDMTKIRTVYIIYTIDIRIYIYISFHGF